MGKLNVYMYNKKKQILEGYLRMRFSNLHQNQRRMCTICFLLVLINFCQNNFKSARLPSKHALLAKRILDRHYFLTKKPTFLEA